MQLNYKCGYCGKSFAKEKTLTVHVCEQKRRHLSKNDKHVQLALLTYQRFYQISQKNQKPKTFDEFASSPYYNAFVKFGSFVSNTNPVYPDRFIDFVIKSGVKLDHWCRDELYDTYIEELIRIEPAEGAIQRTVQTMMDWADANNAPWTHYFRYASLNRVTQHLKDGKVSPWLVLNCKSGKEMLSKFSDEQLEIVYAVVDPQHWALRFKRSPADVELVKEIAQKANL